MTDVTPLPGGGDRAPVVIDVGGQIVENTVVTANLGQRVVLTTRDKIELTLRRELPRLSTADQVLAPLAVFLGLLAALLTAEFKTYAGIGADVWQALFVVMAGVSFMWTLLRIKAYWHRATLDSLVEVLCEPPEE